jgi:hypothetical protein
MLALIIAAGLFGLVLAGAQRLGWPLGVVGVWVNLAWFIYQNEWGQDWLFYLRGVGVGFLLAAGYRQYGLAWALLPWPLLLVGRFNLSLLEPYLPAWGEGLMLGALAYLLAGLFKRP